MNFTAGSPNLTHDPTEEGLAEAEAEAEAGGPIPGLQSFSLLLYCLACLLGVVGNGLVIWVTGFRLRGRTANSVWFLSLSTADFAFTASLPLSVVYTGLGFHWPFGSWLCKGAAWLNALNMYGSVFLLTGVSLDRWASVSLPVWSRNRRGARLALGWSLTCWALAGVLSLPQAAFRDTAELDGNRTVCYNDYWRGLHREAEGASDLRWEALERVAEARHGAVVISALTLGYLCPLTVIGASYGLIWRRLNAMDRAGGRRGERERSSKPYRVMAAVLSAFFLCWTPYHVFKLLEWSGYSGLVMEVGVPLATGLAFLNSCLNPFLYVFVGRDFRRRLRLSLPGVLERVFEEETRPSSDIGLTDRTKASTVPSVTEDASEAV